MKEKRLSAVMAVCLSGALLTLLGLFLTSGVGATHASRPGSPASTPDLIINVQAGDETVLVDEVISYTIFYTNTLGQPLSDVIISSTLSVKQYYSGTYLSAPIVPTDHFTYSGNFFDGHILYWQLGTLAADTGGWIVVTTTLPPEAEPPWKDKNCWPLLGMSAVITTSTPEVSVGNPQGLEGDSASVMVVGPVLQITKEDDPDEVRPGRLLTCTISVENKEREDAITANTIVITDSLPENTVFYSASGTGIYSATSPTAGLIIWHPPDPLEKGSTMAVSFTVRLTESMPTCPPDKISNEDYCVSADETIRIVSGNRQRTDVDDVLEKSIETPDPPSRDHEVFPGGIVTYTISIYNPRHDQLITGLRLTDTLPGEPELFTFADMVDAGPTPVITYPQVVWDDLSVSAGGVTTFSFRVQVPYHIYIAPNKTARNYDNNLSASVPGLVICDMEDKGPSRARVLRQIELDKDVEPDSVLSGELVVYTITLENLGDTTISDIRLTDTLPAGFYYAGMLSGQIPETGYQYNPVVWDGLSVPGGGETLLSFQAVAVGWPLECYNNHLSASSPWTTIPDRTKEAKVCIASPLVMNKTVDPTTTFVEQAVHYEIQVCNVALGIYTLEQFVDYLPAGFYGGGANPYVYDLPSPESLAPGECWEHGFGVRVTIDVGCGNLPHTYENEKGDVQFYVTDPVEAWFYNANDLAPLRVDPHVTIDKEASHKAVLPGETFVYTITLDNGSLIQINDVTVVDTLPNGFEYVEMVAGDNPTDDTEPTIGWQDQTIPSNGQLVLVFRVLAPEDMPLGKNKVEATTTALVCIKGCDVTAQVEVVDEIIEVKKEVDDEEVPSWGVVHYDIQLKNLDSAPVTGVTVTDTLPCLWEDCFEFLTMTASHDDPEPSEIEGQQVIWRDLTVPGNDTLRLRFDVRAAVSFHHYDNVLSASCPRSPITPDEEDIKATVTVLPGVILYKTALPTHTMSGGIVVYTIKLDNRSENALEDVRVTDTLPSGFSYRRMLDGPLPVQLSPVVWKLSQLKEKESQEFVFQVTVGDMVITGTYPNKVEASSPSALIPGGGEMAPVEVEWIDVKRVYLPLVLRGYEP